VPTQGVPQVPTQNRQSIDALFRINVYNGYKFCPSLLKTVGFRAPFRNFRDFHLFSIGSAKIVPPLDVHQLQILCKDVNIFRNHLVMLKCILK
jgi:hypothetical protein